MAKPHAGMEMWTVLNVSQRCRGAAHIAPQSPVSKPENCVLFTTLISTRAQLVTQPAQAV